jgi:deazaflavin-dependent oxidoreductase (nitroreductase family)
MTAAHPYIRPNPFLGRIVNPIVVRLGLATTLVVRGRKSGQPIRVPMGAPLEFEGQRYLVSGRGETHWARNLRAAGTAVLRRGGRAERFRAVEIDGDARVRVLGAYRAKLGHSVDRYWAELPDPADHPVFRIDPPA